MTPKLLSRKKDSPVASPQDGHSMLVASTCLEEDPRFTKVLEVLTVNITTMTDENLEKMILIPVSRRD